MDIRKRFFLSHFIYIIAIHFYRWIMFTSASETTLIKKVEYTTLPHFLIQYNISILISLTSVTETPISISVYPLTSATGTLISISVNR